VHRTSTLRQAQCIASLLRQAQHIAVHRKLTSAGSAHRSASQAQCEWMGNGMGY